MTRPLCLVTGASAGIGAALARTYAAHGWDLALTARREDRLRALAAEVEGETGASCLIVPGDLADLEAPEEIVAAVEAKGRTVDGLVNNAGYGGPGSVAAAEWADQADFLQIMVAAPIHLARLVLPGMMARGFGRVLNVASIAGMSPPAHGTGLYGPVKACLIGASNAMRLEAKGTGVHVTALCPGLTHSEFHEVAQMRAFTDNAPAFLWQSAETVAGAGYRACEADRAVCVPGAVNKIGVALFKILPDSLTGAMARRATRGMRKGGAQ